MNGGPWRMALEFVVIGAACVVACACYAVAAAWVQP